jgi:ribonuclease PH
MCSALRSNLHRCFLFCLVTTMKRRRDGRTGMQLRPIAAEFSLLTSCDGSARLSIGDTDVLVGVQGPRPPKAIRFEDATGALVEVSLSSTCGFPGKCAQRNTRAEADCNQLSASLHDFRRRHQL